MDKKIGEIFKYGGVALITIEDKNNDGCKECYFFNGNICTAESNQYILCSALCRYDNKSVIFKKAEGMGLRTIKLTLEKAKEFYKKGGELRDLALLAFTEEELTKVKLPKTWEEFCSQFNMQYGEYYIYIDSSIKENSDDYRNSIFDKNMLPSKKAAEQHLALMQLHQLRDCYRQGWEPNWSDHKNKYCIVYNGGGVCNYVISINAFTSTFLSFQSREIAQLFLNNFRNLIEEAGDLI